MSLSEVNSSDIYQEMERFNYVIIFKERIKFNLKQISILYTYIFTQYVF